ncbi:MAG: DUF1573 domain-containing protein [Candidatus Zixiibacteriota bacterium]
MTARVFGLSLLVAAFGLICCSALVAGPAVEIPSKEFDFGKAVQHAKLHHAFWIKSVGDDTLRITRIEPGCGCTKAPIEDSVLAPGDSTLLQIYFSTKSFRGQVSKKPYIETNVDATKHYMRIMAELVTETTALRPIEITPSKLDVSQFSQKPRRSARFHISNSGDSDLRIIVVDQGNKYFDVKLPEKLSAGETIEGIIRVRDDAIEQEFEQSITFEIDDEEHSRFSLPVKRMYRLESKSVARRRDK